MPSELLAALSSEVFPKLASERTGCGPWREQREGGRGPCSPPPALRGGGGEDVGKCGIHCRLHVLPFLPCPPQTSQRARKNNNLIHTDNLGITVASCQRNVRPQKLQERCSA